MEWEGDSKWWVLLGEHVLASVKERRVADGWFWGNTAFQTAVALADFDNEKNEDGKIILHKRHIQQIVNMSKEFKDYLRELHRGDEAKRADRQRIRYDEFDQKR